MTDAGWAPVDISPERRRAHAAFLAQVAVFAIGATSAIQIANFTVTAAVGGLPAARAGMLAHDAPRRRPGAAGAGRVRLDFLPGVLPGERRQRAVAERRCARRVRAVFDRPDGAHRVARSIGSRRSGGIGVGTVVFFLTKGIELTHTGNFLDLWKYGIAHCVDDPHRCSR